MEISAELLRDLLLGIVADFEKLTIENLSQKAVLQHALPRPGEPSLQKQLQDTIKDVQRHRKFAQLQRIDGLRQQISQAAEDRQLTEVLKRFPSKGEMN